MYRWKAYNQHDIILNLERRGHIVDEVKGEMCNFEDDPSFIMNFSRVLDQEEYDLVFTVNYFPVISDICQGRQLTYLVWCCDSPLATMYHQSVFHSVNKIFTFDKFSQMTFADLGAPVYYLPLCGATDRVDELLDSASDLASYQTQIAFVGSMYNKNSYDEVYDRLPAYLQGYFDATIKLQANVYSEYLLDDILDAKTVYELNRNFILAKSDESFSDMPLIFSTTILGFKIAQLERKTLLPQIARLGSLRVYTDDTTVDFVTAKNCGLVDYWDEAPKVFRESLINLNFTIKNIRSGIPLRVWDILSAGGFCITNYQAELPFYFENKVDLVWFESQQELFELITYYLEHEEERKEIARRGYEKVKEFHTYQHRFDQISHRIPGI